MSIGFAGLHLLLPALRSLPRTPETRILFLGTQDLLFTYDQAEAFFKRQGIAVHALDPEERRLTDSFAYVGHRDWWKYRNFLHQETLLRMLGFQASQLHTLDVDDYEHAEIIQDLNCALSCDVSAYDLILDQGTLEHVFDIKQALWNLSDLARIGGQVVHMSPAGALNHGFYNFNAGLFADFYDQSGWKREELFYTLVPKAPIGEDEVHAEQGAYAKIAPERLDVIPGDFQLNIFGRFRKTQVSSKTIAVQGPYLELHKAWKHQTREPSPIEASSDAPRLPAWRRWLKLLTTRWRRAQALRRLKALGAELVLIDTG